MKCKVTEMRKGQVQNEFSAIGMKGAVKAALVLLSRELEVNVLHLAKDCQVEICHLSNSEWSCTVTHKDEEVYGLQVQKDY